MEEKNQKKTFFFNKNKNSAKENREGLGVFFIEVLKIAVISLAIIIPVRYFLIQPFVVKGSSMEPNFSSGDYLIIDEISYRFAEPQRGDVVVFKYPRNPSQYYIKRIIALPGEKIQIKNGTIVVFTNEYPGGIEIDESYIPENIRTPGDVDALIGEREYFVLGDNRTASSDSRVWGKLEKDKIIGKAWVRGWPIEDIGKIEMPQY